MPDLDSALRKRVRVRANECCEYCQISEQVTLTQHEIDHVIALKHGGQTIEANLALCCSICNRYKGSDIASLDPDNAKLTSLFHPRLDRWSEHFRLINGEIVALTAEGRVTVMLLRMNRPNRMKERQLFGGTEA